MFSHYLEIIRFLRIGYVMQERSQWRVQVSEIRELFNKGTTFDLMVIFLFYRIVAGTLHRLIASLQTTDLDRIQ